MRVEIEVEGRSHIVTVERTAQPGRYRIDVDGRSHDVDAVALDGRTLSVILGGTQESYLAGFAATATSGDWLVRIDDEEVPLRVNGRRRRGDSGGAAGTGEQRITAPMPGKVVRVLVSPGDDVSARQPVVVVEAMKMENALLVARAGRVRDVAVSEGMSVEAGRLLVIVE